MIPGHRAVQQHKEPSHIRVDRHDVSPVRLRGRKYGASEHLSSPLKARCFAQESVEALEIHKGTMVYCL